ncbi:MAG: copper homeostasis membrane protein CopD [Asticcacaulis sp.]|uniref:copper homeostasis membrane protein CopD n=1 Tax=Asticcacaulis sp. TaxID=1872648 RepID=UPI003F7C6B01
MDGAALIGADVARFLQYSGASVLFGTALFLLIGMPASDNGHRWSRSLFLGAAVALVAGACLSLAAQSAMMNGVALNALTGDDVWLVLSATQWGYALAARLAFSLIAVVLAVLKPNKAALVVLGAGCLISFAYTGHGAGDDGPAGTVHLINDMAHSLAAGVWLGALAGFFILLRRPDAVDAPQAAILAKALSDFSRIGTASVSVLLLTGLINSAFLIGLAGLPKLLSSAYGVLLSVKLVLFVIMLSLAARNRFYLTPDLLAASDEASRRKAMSALRLSVTLETLAGLAILALVAVFGMMEPPASM